ncbi:MAG: hypothetical protein DBX59_11555 [Bacillota bacterium]|nr:MAG: hypothetical protein DBX59_11555 [Bacillota bacterium]
MFYLSFFAAAPQTIRIYFILNSRECQEKYARSVFSVNLPAHAFRMRSFLLFREKICYAVKDTYF